jgi:hypothetical protein
MVGSFNFVLCVLILIFTTKPSCVAWKFNLKGISCDQSVSRSLDIKVLQRLGGVIAAVAIPLAGVGCFPNTANAAYPPSLDMSFVDTAGKFSFGYTKDFVVSPKLLKTHQIEVYLKSEAQKGFSVGLTGDKVKLPTIKEFATPTGLGEKVKKVEESKDGVMEVEIVTVTESTIPTSAVVANAKTGIEADAPSVPAYAIEYKVESTRGKNHYNVMAAIYNNNLFVFTAQSKEDSYDSLKSSIADIMGSLVIAK